jgi:hypothetical protein
MNKILINHLGNKRDARYGRILTLSDRVLLMDTASNILGVTYLLVADGSSEMSILHFHQSTPE